MVSRTVKALALVSGGLDSLLAVKVLQEQGVEVTGVTFESPFFGAAKARAGAAQLGIELRVVDITEEILALIKSPPHGFGKNLNPCIDCHALMVRKAGELMVAEGFDLIATGEVLGERPMSQNRQSLETVATESGVGDRLLRPLSARLLTPTQPEREGLIDRERLLAIEGRSRKPQMKLAAKVGIRSYVQPAGGCLLTDPSFSRRLRELLEHEPQATARDARLLTMGRHFRLPSGAKLIVGRDEKDNARVEAAALPEEAVILPAVAAGPSVLLVKGAGAGDIQLAARICVSFSDHEGKPVELLLRRNGEERPMSASPSPRGDFDQMRI